MAIGKIHLWEAEFEHGNRIGPEQLLLEPPCPEHQHVDENRERPAKSLATPLQKTDNQSANAKGLSKWVRKCGEEWEGGSNGKQMGFIDTQFNSGD